MNRSALSLSLGAALGVGMWLGCGTPPDTLGNGVYSGGPAASGTTPVGTATVPSGTPTSTGTGTGTGTPPVPGTDSGVTATPQTAQQYYETMVDPALEPTCATCHATGANNAPRFLAPTPAAAYATIESFGGLVAAPSASPLLLHGAHEGPALTTAQVTVVTTWLNMEIAAHPPPPGSGITPDQALTTFGNCMSLADFTKQNNGFAMADLANLQTADRGPCQSCHNRGTAGFWASSGNYQGTNESTVMFNMTQQVPYIDKIVTTEVNNDGSYKDIVPANRVEAKQQAAAACAQTNQTDCHPVFSLPQGQADAINTFITATQTRMTANQCGTGTGIADAGGGG